MTIAARRFSATARTTANAAMVITTQTNTTSRVICWINEQVLNVLSLQSCLRERTR